MKKTICDKCGEECTPNNGIRLGYDSYALYKNGDNTVTSGLDLCKKCRKNVGEVIREWIKYAPNK